MNRRAFLATLGATSLAGCGGLLGPDLDAETVAVHFRDYVNDARSEKGVGYFATDETLVDVATYHAEDMLDGDYFGMNSPSGESLADRYRKFEYSCGGGDPPSGSVAVGNAVLLRVRSGEEGITEREVAEEMFDRLLATPEKKELAFWNVWEIEGTGAAVGSDAEGRTLVYLTQYYC